MKTLSEITDLLEATDEDARREALLALKGKSHTEDTSELLKLFSRGIQDASWRVRKTALNILMEEIHFDDYVPALIELLYLEDNAGARNTAVEGLVKLGSRATGMLVSAFNTPNADVRKFIVDIVGEVLDHSAAPLLVKALTDEDENVKASAVEYLGSIKEPSVVDALIDILNEGNLWSGYPAAEALGKIGDVRAVPVLITSLNNKMMREPALRALGRLGDENIIQNIVPFLKDRSRAVQHMAIYALEELYHRGISEDAIIQGIRNGLGEQASRILLDQVTSAREEVRASSILFLGLMRDDRVLEPLLELSQEDEFEADIRRAFIFIGKERPEALLHFHRTGKPLQERFLCDILSEVAAEEYFDALMHYLNSDDGHVRSLAAKGLGRIGDIRAIEHLKRLLTDEYEDVRESALYALTSLKEGLDTVELLENLKSDDILIRKSAVFLLGGLDTEESLVGICNSLEDKFPAVRHAAIKALSSKSDELALKHIENALADEDPYIRMMAAQRLGESADEHYLEPLSSLLLDDEVKVRVSAAKAIGMLGTQRAVKNLVDLLDDNDGFVLTSIIEALGRLGGEEAKAALVRVLSHKDKEVQRAALHALSSFVDTEDIIIPFLEHPDWATRVVAAQSLQASDKNHVRQKLENALNSEEDIVVRKALMGAMSA